MIITSSKNSFIVSLKKLCTNSNVLCLDNPKLIAEAVKTNLELLYVIKTEDYIGEFSDSDVIVSGHVLKQFTNTVTSQGVVALVKFENKPLKPPNKHFLILDNVQDPGNVGTLIRSAVGADFMDIYLVNCASVTNSKTVRSSMGALFKANVYQCADIKQHLKSWNLPVYIADMNGENIFETKFENVCGVVIGNEGNGVSAELCAIATKKISIPMQNDLESLNAGVSGSIIMYQIANGGKNVRS